MRNQRSIQSVLIGASAVLATLLFSACEVSLVNDGDTSGTPTGRPSNTPTTGAQRTPGADSTTPTASSAGATPSGGGGAATNGLTYAGYSARLANASKEIPCDRGPVELTESGPAVRLVGSCGQVTISGDAVGVIADQVDAVTVSGSGVVFMARSIKDVTFTADAFASEVYWLGGQPNVTDNGAGNTARTIPEGP